MVQSDVRRVLVHKNLPLRNKHAPSSPEALNACLIVAGFISPERILFGGSLPYYLQVVWHTER
jgi:hypothetical protein